MKLTRILTVVSCAVLAACSLAQKAAQPQAESGWSTDFAHAMARAKKEHKVVMVDFSATWCGPCQMYKKQVFPGDKFKKATKNMILVAIDTDQQPDIAKKYGVDGIPDIRFISPQGKEIGRMVGFGGEKPLLDQIEKAKAKAKSS